MFFFFCFFDLLVFSIVEQTCHCGSIWIVMSWISLRFQESFFFRNAVVVWMFDMSVEVFCLSELFCAGRLVMVSFWLPHGAFLVKRVCVNLLRTTIIARDGWLRCSVDAFSGPWVLRSGHAGQVCNGNEGVLDHGCWEGAFASSPIRLTFQIPLAKFLPVPMENQRRANLHLRFVFLCSAHQPCLSNKKRIFKSKFHFHSLVFAQIFRIRFSCFIFVSPLLTWQCGKSHLKGKGRNGKHQSPNTNTAERPGPPRRFQFWRFFSVGCCGRVIAKNTPLRTACCSEASQEQELKCLRLVWAYENGVEHDALARIQVTVGRPKQIIRGRAHANQVTSRGTRLQKLLRPRPLLVQSPVEDRSSIDARTSGLSKKEHVWHSWRSKQAVGSAICKNTSRVGGASRGSSAKTLFRHEGHGVSGMTHGDDFVDTGQQIGSQISRGKLQWWTQHWTEECVVYQHDPRHVDVFVTDFGLEHVNSVQTPAVHHVTDKADFAAAVTDMFCMTGDVVGGLLSSNNMFLPGQDPTNNQFMHFSI